MDEAQGSSTINRLAGQENSQTPLRSGDVDSLREVGNDDDSIPGIDSLEGQVQPSELRPLLLSEQGSNSDMSLDTSVAERDLATQAEPTTVNGLNFESGGSTARPAIESATSSHTPDGIPAKPPTFNGPRKIKFTFKKSNMGVTAGVPAKIASVFPAET